MFLDEIHSDSGLEQDRESTNHQLYVLENPKKRSEHSGEYSITFADQNNMILPVKALEEVESQILMSHTSFESYELRYDQVESCDDLLNEVTSATATCDPSKNQMSSLGEGVEEFSSNGFRTPTKFLDDEPRSHRLKCPPAPRKPESKPLGKRKRVCRNLQIEFVNEVESVLRLLISGDHSKVKKARC